jgi:hypothetical protein
MSPNLTLDEFPPVSTEQWNEVVLKDLKGAAPKTKLYYRAEDLKGLEYLDSAPGSFPYTRGTRGSNEWRIREVVHDAASARAALDAGAEEICFILGDQKINEVLETLPGVPFILMRASVQQTCWTPWSADRSLTLAVQLIWNR